MGAEGLQQREGAVDVGGEEGARPCDRAIDVGFSRQVGHMGDGVLSQQTDPAAGDR